MTNEELVALSALVYQESIIMAGENQQREREGYTPAYRDSYYTISYWALKTELQSRGISC